MIATPQLPVSPCSFSSSQEERPGDDAQPAVVDHQVESRRRFLQSALLLRTRIQGSLVSPERPPPSAPGLRTTLPNTRLMRLKRRSRAAAYRGAARRDEIVLHEGEPATVGAPLEFRLVRSESWISRKLLLVIDAKL